MNMEKVFNEIKNKLITNENLMKLLYYDTSDALSKENVTFEQIYDLLHGFDEIRNHEGKIVSKNKRILNRMSSPDMMNYVHSEIRFYPRPMPQNGLIKTLIFFEIIVHEDIESLDNGHMRSWEIYREIYNTLKHCNAIGKLNFNNNSTKEMHYGKSYYGYMFYCTTYLSGRYI